MEDYSIIIDSLVYKIERVNQIEVKTRFQLNSFSETRNTIIMVNSGNLFVGKEQRKLEIGEVLFVPENVNVILTFGKTKNEADVYTPEMVLPRRNEFMVNLPYQQRAAIKSKILNMTTLTFEARAYDSVNFFSVLSVDWFVLPASWGLAPLLKSVYDEFHSQKLSRDQMLASLISVMVIKIMRHIDKGNLFIEKLSTKRNYFKDRRILRVFKYIDINLGGDLSNKKLSEAAEISEDYFSHYFKSITGMAPQDFVEYQRMERATSLLRHSKKKIHQIAKDLGYSDTSYFCRRFKKIYGATAAMIRKRELNI
jgi:AraC-like DNA-binding protein